MTCCTAAGDTLISALQQHWHRLQGAVFALPAAWQCQAMTTHLMLPGHSSALGNCMYGAYLDLCQNQLIRRSDRVCLKMLRSALLLDADFLDDRTAMPNYLGNSSGIHQNNYTFASC